VSVEENQRRSVIVTEASTGIGRATAERLARAGHLVLLGSRRPEVCERLAAELRAGGAAVFAAHLDLADTASIDAFVEAAGYLVGSVDVLVSHACASSPLDTNVVATQHLAARLAETTRPLPGVHSSSKHALEAWVAVLQAELGSTGLRASIVRPGHRHLRLIEVIPSAPRTMEATN
jgi:NAD(P)-dependent dehydrogenase (short-subunit alcohol dehydrogenase family)